MKNPIFSDESLYIISPWGIRRDLNEDLSGWGRLNLRTNFNQKCRFSSQMGNFWDRMRKFSIKSADFRIKSAGVLKWVFKNIRKRSKIFKNIQKYSNFEYKRSKIFENIRKCVRSFLA